MSTLKRYWKTAAMAGASYVGDSPLFLLDYLLRFLRVAVLLALWRVILAGKGPVSGMTLEQVLTYTLIAEVFGAQLAPRTEVDRAFWRGEIILRLLQPLGIFGQYTAEMAGKWLFELFAFGLPLLLLAPLLGVNPLPADAAAAGLFLVSLALGISVGLALEFVFGALLVVLALPLWAVYNIRTAITTLLSGALLPLALLPAGVGAVLSLLPFASMASAPLQLYVGTGDAPRLLALQVAWSVLLWPLAHWLWRISRERMVSYGG
ncbi:MAG TPA: ABC-2 family transporter protein [Roseiflexaceae bacterium]|nr:ABC-2 family transporter protein [Roseiflexaceae bacterium]